MVAQEATKLFVFFWLNFLIFLVFLSNLIVFVYVKMFSFFFMVINKISNNWWVCHRAPASCSLVHKLYYVTAPTCLLVYGGAAHAAVLLLPTVFFWVSFTPVFMLSNSLSFLTSASDSRGITSSLKMFLFFPRFLLFLTFDIRGWSL